MAEIVATLTAEALELFGSYLNGDCVVPQVGALAPFKVASFKVGEGGWTTTVGGIVPRVPDPTLEDLDCIENPSRYGPEDVATFSKNLAVGVDMALTVSTSAVTFEATCVLDTGEFNDDGFGNFPEIGEIGLFGPHPITAGTFMIAYGTFARQQKTPADSLPNIVKIVLQLG
jgi:hypothetical protein